MPSPRTVAATAAVVLALGAVGATSLEAATPAAADPAGTLALAGGASAFLDTGTSLAASTGGALFQAVSADAAGRPQGKPGPLTLLPSGGSPTSLAAAFQQGTASISGSTLAALDPATGTVTFRSVDGTVAGSTAPNAVTAPNFDGAAPPGWLRTSDITSPGGTTRHVYLQAVAPAATTDLGPVPSFDPTRGISVTLPGTTGAMVAVVGSTVGTTRHEFVSYGGGWTRLDDGPGAVDCGPASVGATAAAWVEAASLGAGTSVLVRAPLSGAPAQRTTLPVPCSAVSAAPVTTATATGLVADTGSGPRLYTAASAGGALLTSSGLALTQVVLASTGTAFEVLLGTSSAGSRIASLPDAAATPVTVYAFPASALVAGSVAVGPGRAAWTDDAQQGIPVWSRPVTGSSALALGPPALEAAHSTGDVVGSSVAVSGRRTVYLTTDPDPTTHLPVSVLWLTVDGGPPRQLAPAATLITRTAISGTWVLYASTGSRGPAWTLIDLAAGGSTTLPAAGFVDYAIGGDTLAALRDDGSVWQQHLSALAAPPVQVVAGGTPGSVSGRVAASSDWVAWVRQACDLVGGACTTSGGYRNVRTAAPAVALPDPGGQQALAVSDSYLLYQNAAHAIAARALVAGTTSTVVTGVGTTNQGPGVSLSGSVAAWLGDDRLPRVAPLPHVSAPPRLLGRGTAAASFVPEHTGTWTADLVASAPLTACSVALSGSSGPVRTLPCDTGAMAEGEALVSWDGTAAGSRVPPGTYTWTLTASGADGPLQDVDGSATAPSGSVVLSAGSGYTALAPCRVLDTRVGTGTCSGVVAGAAGPIVAGTARAVHVTGIGAVPTSASSVVLNVTVVGASTRTFVTVWPHGSRQPVVSNLNVSSAAPRANLVTVPVGALGDVDVSVGAGAAHVIVDLQGYYAPATGQAFTPTGPCRVFDTRHAAGTCAGSLSGAGAPSGPLGPGATLSVQVAGVGGVPSDATAVVLNVTAVGATTATYVSVWPGALARPLASTLNVSGADPVPNLVVVPLGSDGRVQLYNRVGSVNLLADLAGYFGPASVATFEAVGPCRVLDTRVGVGGCPAGATTAVGPVAAGAGNALRVKITGVAGIPATATAVVLNVTAVGASSATFVTVWPDGQPLPATSNLNVVGSAPVANLVVVRVGAGGFIDLMSGASSVNLIADVAGFFAPPSP